MTADLDDLYVEHELFSGRGMATGWAHTEPREEGDPAIMTSHLQEVELPIQEREVCYTRYRDDFQEGTACVGKCTKQRYR